MGSAVARDWIATEAKDLLARYRVAGMAVGVCDADRVLWSSGFGQVSNDDPRPVGTATMFSLQSASKMLTATAVMCAVRDGLVELDTPLPAYLPEFSVHSA